MFSLRWTRFHWLVIFGPTEFFRYNRSIQLSATDFTTGKTVCHLFCVSSVPAPLNESCPLQASHFYKCFVLWLKDQTLLGNWCQRGRERSHQSLSFRERSHQRIYHLLRGRKRSPGGENTQVESTSQGSQMPGVQEERCHMSSWGERHVHMCLFALACINSVHLYLSALIFCSLSSPSILC